MAEGQVTGFEDLASRGDGLPELLAALVSFAQDYFGGGEGGLIGRTRQRKLLEETAASLRTLHRRCRRGRGTRGRRIENGKFILWGGCLAGVDVEDILDVIFREFCVGK